MTNGTPASSQIIAMENMVAQRDAEIERLRAIVERASRLEALYHNTNLNPEGFRLTIEVIARDAKAVLTP